MEQQLDQLQVTLNNYKQQYVEFIETAAHDLQAPLRKLAVLTERLTAKYQLVPQEEVQQYVIRINTCLSDMRALIDGFGELALVIPDSANYSECDFERIIKKILQELAPAIKEKNAVITVSPLPRFVCGDPNQYRQVFKKILDNAIRFNRGDIPIQIAIASAPLSEEEKEEFELAKEKVYHKIIVSDNGMGFDQEYAARIFQPLVRLNGKSDFEGSGMGLAICKRIVNNHGGILYAEGTENKGARFILILPEKP